jgi:hypothetical protein
MTTEMLGERLLVSAAELAAMCGVNKQRIAGLVRAGLLPAPLPRKGPGKFFWSAAAVQEHLRRNSNGER